jgi:hypothetical protein
MVQTVEGEVRAELARRLGGLRGSVETAAPLVVFTVAYLTTDDTRTAVLSALTAAAVAYGLRLLRRSETTFALQGLVGIVVAAVFVSITGEAESAFLPGLLQSGAWALLLGVTLLVRWPAAGFVIGAILHDLTGWRCNPAMFRLANRLTVVLLAPMVIRLGVQIPLYLAGEVGWLAVSRVALGWPLQAATLAVAGLILLRGKTPLPDGSGPTPS